MMKSSYIKMRMLGSMLMLLGMVTGPSSVWAQGRVHGTVHDLEGRPVIGTVFCSSSVSIVKDGVFEITPLHFPDTIRITAMGFAAVTRIIHGPGTLSIRMTPTDTQLEEVVISTGYQTASPNEINGSVALITSDMLSSRTTGNILERIQGHASGLTTLVGKRETADGGSGVLVRGLGTLHGPIEPLIVLDGFIYDGDIDNIDPNTVDHVTILKDAAASSIWGARAGNGVIVITTKKGQFNQRIRISVQADRSIQAPPALSETYRVGAATHIEMEKFLFDQGYFDQRIRNTPYLGLSPVVDLLARQRDGQISQTDFDRELAFWAKQDARENYLDAFYTTAHTQNLGLQINGGSERNSYMMGASYHDRNGNLYDRNRRLNLRINNQFRIIDNLTLSTNVQLAHHHTQSGRSGYGTFRPGGRTIDYLAFRDGQGDILPLDINYKGRYTDSIGEGILLDWKYYPTEEYRYIDSYNNRLDLFSTIGVTYRAFTWLDLSGSFQYQIQNSRQVVHTKEDSYFSRDLINQFTQVHPVTGVVSYVVPLGGLYNSSEASVGSFAWRGQANFDHHVNGHRITGIVGMELRGSGTSSRAHARLHGYQDDPLAYNHIDLHTRYPHFITGALASVGVGSNELSRTDYRFVSYYGNIAYTYLNRYTLSGSARRDGSNLFGVHTNDRWKPLWSAGLGWNISNEPFYAANYLSDLKAVFSYGRSGNVDMTKTALPIAAISTHHETGLRFAGITAINNPELRWEQQDQLSLRLEGQVKNRKLKGSLGFFKKYGTDLYGDAPYDFTGWGVSRTLVRNVASMEGYGLELDLHASYMERNRFKWTGGWYLTWNENKTTAYYISSNNHDLARLLVDGTSINPVIGYSLYAIAARKWAGLDGAGNPMGYLEGKPSTDYQAINLEGRSTGDNIVYMGSATPRYYGSMFTELHYGPVRLSVGLNFHFGYYLKKNYFSSGSAINSAIHQDYLKRWQQPGDELITDIPAFVYPVVTNRDSFYGVAEPNVIPGDQIRLDYVRLKYGMDTSQWKHPFRYMEINMGMENGGLLWKKNKSGVDPNFISGNQTSMIWSFGINAQF